MKNIFECLNVKRKNKTITTSERTNIQKQMGHKRKEIFCFTQSDTGKSATARENHRTLENTINYMNRFTISEDDGFDISGVHHLVSPLGFPIYTKELNKLPTTSEHVYIFISLCFNISSPSAIKYWNDQRLLFFKGITQNLLTNISKDVESLHISMMEFQVASVKIQNKVVSYRKDKTKHTLDRSEVESLYNRQTLTKMSFYNQLDDFYEHCRLIEDRVKKIQLIDNESISFFLAKMMDSDVLEAYQTQFAREQSDFMLKCIKAAISRKEIDPAYVKMIEENYRQRNEKILKESKGQEYRLFTGMRISISLCGRILSRRSNHAIVERIIDGMKSKLPEEPAILKRTSKNNRLI